MKKKLIATAVAGTFVAPAVMAQEAEVSPYFRINNALEWRDVDGGDSTTDIRNVSSRIGIRGSYDLGNGTSVFGQYEFSTFTDREGATNVADDGTVTAGRGGINDTRIGIVGVSGSFGTVSVGNQWSAFFNTVGTHMDPTYSMGYVIYSSAMGGPYRASNTIKYNNSFGPVTLEVDGRFSQDRPDTGQDVEKIGGDNGEDFLDGFAIGANFAVTEAVTLAAVYDVEQFDVGDDVERIGAAGMVTFGNFYGRLAYMTVEQDDAGLDNELVTAYVGSSFGETGNAYIGYQVGENAAGQEPDQIILHADHRLGDSPLRLFYEGTFVDFDGAGTDFDTHLFGMRIDF